jgi:transcriptional regulator with XRE-family HTH domain
MDTFLNFTFASDEEVAGELGARLKAHRLAKKLRQVDLATRAGIALGTLKRLEARGVCTLGSLIQVVRALGLESELQGLFKLPEPKSIAAMEAQAATRPKRVRYKK